MSKRLLAIAAMALLPTGCGVVQLDPEPARRADEHACHERGGTYVRNDGYAGNSCIVPPTTTTTEDSP